MSQAGAGLLAMSLVLLFLVGVLSTALEWERSLTVVYLLALGSLISSLLGNIERVLRLTFHRFLLVS